MNRSWLRSRDNRWAGDRNLALASGLWPNEHTRYKRPSQVDFQQRPETVGADIISVAELTQKLFADAKALGINSVEIEEETGSGVTD